MVELGAWLDGLVATVEVAVSAGAAVLEDAAHADTAAHIAVAQTVRMGVVTMLGRMRR